MPAARPRNCFSPGRACGRNEALYRGSRDRRRARGGVAVAAAAPRRRHPRLCPPQWLTCVTHGKHPPGWKSRTATSARGMPDCAYIGGGGRPAPPRGRWGSEAGQDRASPAQPRPAPRQPYPSRSFPRSFWPTVSSRVPWTGTKSGGVSYPLPCGEGGDEANRYLFQ